jgi:predicted Zn-dependent protease
VRAQFRANLGALRQTRVELAVYEWPKWPLQDAVRRAHEIDLAPALADFHAALELDPTNVTANRRLGQIELSLARYQDARTHLAAAFMAAPGQTATRQLYGESLAATGDVPQAAQMWRSIPLDQDQLQLRQAWHEMSDQEIAKRIASARALMRGAAARSE